MKRSYSHWNIFSSEKEMSKKAAMESTTDLAERKSSNSTSVKDKDRRIRYSSKGAPMYTLDSLPPNIIHLGGENFVSVNHFLGHTRVHIRRYVADDEGYYQPSKEGVSIPASVWISFQSHLDDFDYYKSSDETIVVDNDLCVSRYTKDSEQFIAFQRLYKREDMSFQFVPERVILTSKQLSQLSGFTPTINEKIKESLIKYSLPYHIYREFDKKDRLGLEKYFERVDLLKKSLVMCITFALSVNINKITDCKGCKETGDLQFMHNCLRSRADKFEECFERAFHLINFCDVAKDFVERNCHVEIADVFAQSEFFDVLNVNDFIYAIEKMYVGHEEKEFEKFNDFC